MQDIKIKINKDGWCRCGNCGHKLFKIQAVNMKALSTIDLEIKCHSCKEINKTKIGGRKNEV